MGAAKWLGGIFGWAAAGPLGGLLGFLLGSAFDGISAIATGAASAAQPSAASAQQQQRNSFLFSLLVLSSAVIKADKKILQSELDYVHQFLERQFGSQTALDGMVILKELNAKEVNIYEVGDQIGAYMNYSQRQQLFYYLVQIALSDGEFSKSEKDLLEVIASAIRLQKADADSVIAMFYKDADAAYAVLEISPSATDDEVRTAYRRMAMKHHPDKVATLGPDVQKAAAEKFRQVQDAYDTIKRERGIA